MATNDTKAVVVTGASSGIGEACALRMDKGGFRVFAGVRKEQDAARLKEQGSERLTTLLIDVTDQASIEAAAKAVADAVGDAGIAGLVNNAGISVPGPLEFLTTEDLRKQLEVNVIGQVAVTQAFMPLIRKGQGRIVNIGSIGGKMATPFLGAYNASKFAMEAITDSLRQELRPWNIQVSIVEPGSIATRIWEKGQAAGDELERNLPEEALMYYRQAISALREAARKFEEAGIAPDEVARFVEHALTASTPKTRYVVGRDAQLQRVIARVVPDRLRDRMVASQLRLPTEP